VDAARPEADGGVEDAGDGRPAAGGPGHPQPQDRSVTAVYDRYGADPEKQRALREWERRVEEIAGGGAEGRVVEFRVHAEGRFP